MSQLFIFSSLCLGIYGFLNGTLSPLDLQKVIFKEFSKIEDVARCNDLLCENLVKVVEFLNYDMQCVECYCYCSYCECTHNYHENPEEAAMVTRCVKLKIKKFLSEFFPLFPKDQLLLESMHSLPHEFMDEYHELVQNITQNKITLQEAHASLNFWKGALPDNVLDAALFNITLNALSRVSKEVLNLQL